MTENVLENIVKVRAEIRVPYKKEPKLINYGLSPVFDYVENGEKKRIRFVDGFGNDMPINISPDFFFDLNVDHDKANYATLLKRMEHDYTLDLIKIDDENRTADKETETMEYKIKVSSKVMMLKENNDFETINHIHRRTIGSVVGITEKVVYKRVMDAVEKNPKLVHEIITDADFEYSLLVSKAVERSLIQVENGVYKNRIGGAIIAQDTASMIFYLKNNPEFKNALTMQMSDTPFVPITASQIQEAKAAMPDEFFKTSEPEPELFITGEDEKALTSDQVRELVDQAIARQIGIHKNGFFLKVLSIDQNFKKDKLYEFYDKNPEQAVILQQLIEQADRDK